MQKFIAAAAFKAGEQYGDNRLPSWQQQNVALCAGQLLQSANTWQHSNRAECREEMKFCFVWVQNIFPASLVKIVD